MEDDRVFRALADPTRRLLLDQLFERDGRTLSELVSLLEMTRFGVMKHLRALEDAGLVVTRKAGREKLHYLNPVPIQLLSDRWIGKYADRVAALADLKAALEGETDMTTNVSARPKQVYETYIRASRQAVWDALTRSEFTTRYFCGFSLDTNAQAGGPYRLLAGETPMVEGEVLQADPPSRLVHSWRMMYSPEVMADAPSRVTWELEEVAEGVTKLTTIHDEFDGETATFKDVAGGWSAILSSLKSLLETGEALPINF